MNAIKGLVGDSHFFEETVNTEKIKKLLDNVASGSGMASIMEKTEGMKYLLAMQSQGHDVSEFYPDVVRNVIVKNVEVKKLVYMYLVHHADANATCRELALLAINSFQRDLAGRNQLIRSLALRVMCSIRVREIVQIQLLAVKKCASDSSPYVRKTAAHSISKIFSLDPDQKVELVTIIERLLGDRSVMVLGSVIQAFTEVCPERLELLHPHYRRLAHTLPDVDEWGQIVILNLLLRYVRTQFVDPRAELELNVRARKTKHSDSESSESEDEMLTTVAAMDDDLKALLASARPLLRSRNSGVVLAVASLFHYAGPRARTDVAAVGKALVRVMRHHREMKYVLLSNITTLATECPEMFRDYLKDFFVSDMEPAFVRVAKLNILVVIASEGNASLVLKEFTRYVVDPDKAFVRAVIDAVGRIATKLPDFAPRVLRGLMGLVQSSDDAVVASSVVALRQLLQRHPDNDATVKRLISKLESIKVPAARAAIVWIVGEFQKREAIAVLAPDALRVLAKGFRGEASEVKIQILNLAVKLSLQQPDVRVNTLLMQYVLELARFDMDYDIRDRARMMRALLLSEDPEAMSRAEAVLLAPKPPPVAESAPTMFGSSDAPATGGFAVGTLSQLVHHATPGFVSLPAFPEVAPDPTVRDVMEEAADGSSSRKSRKAKAKAAKKKSSGFYSDEGGSSSSSSEEEDDGTTSGSGSESGSGSGSESGSGSDDDDGDGDDDGDDGDESSGSGSGTESGSGSDSSGTDTEEEEE